MGSTLETAFAVESHLVLDRFPYESDRKRTRSARVQAEDHLLGEIEILGSSRHTENGHLMHRKALRRRAEGLHLVDLSKKKP